MLYLKGDTAASISAPGTSLPASESEKMPQERRFFSSYFFDLNNIEAEGEQNSWFLWVLQLCRVAFYVQDLPARVTVLEASGLCFPSLISSPGRDAHNQISQFTLPTFQPEKQLFSTSILVSIFPSIFHPILLWILFHRGLESDQMVFAFLVWSWWVHCYPEAFLGLLNLGYVQKNFLLHISVALSWVLHLFPACEWLSCWKQPLEELGEAVEVGPWWPEPWEPVGCCVPEKANSQNVLG